jgi:hypothetical protein
VSRTRVPACEQVGIDNFIACDWVALKKMSSTTATAWLADQSLARGITTVRKRILALTSMGERWWCCVIVFAIDVTITVKGVGSWWEEGW